MKKNYSIAYLAQAFVIIVLIFLLPVIATGQEYTEEKRQELCQSNKDAVAVLEKKARNIDDELTGKMDKNRRAELVNDKKDIDKQLAFHRNRLIALRCDKSSNTKVINKETLADWTGTFTGNFYGTTTLKLNEGEASYSRQDGLTQKGEWTLTEVKGNVATGTWTESFEDTDKTVQRNGTITATLDGNTLSFTYVEKEPSFSWKPGIKEYKSGMKDGAKWSGTLTRKE